MFLAQGVRVSPFILEYKQAVGLGGKPRAVYDGWPNLDFMCYCINLFMFFRP